MPPRSPARSATGWSGSRRSAAGSTPTGCSRTIRRAGWGSSDAASAHAGCAPRVRGITRGAGPVPGVDSPVSWGARRRARAPRRGRAAGRLDRRIRSRRSAMRRIAAGLALALSVSLSSTAQADPGRSQYEDPPPPGQAAAPTTAALNPSWKRWGPAPWPAPRMSAYAVVDPSHERMVVFGGWGSGYFSDTWMLDLASDTWTQSPADTVHPGPRMEYASIHDPVRN